MDKCCALCPRPGKACGGCNNVHYCSRIHQEDDGALHKTVCRQFKVLSERPSPDMCRVIYFPVDGGNPEFKWMPKKNTDVEGEPHYEEPNYGTLLGNDEPMTDRCDISRNPVMDRNLPHDIMLKSRGLFMTDGSEANKCILGITEGECDEWRGPIFAYGYTEDEDSTTKCVDLDTTDLKNITDWFLGQRNLNESYRGVLISCDGEYARLRGNGFHAVRVHDFDNSPLSLKPLYFSDISKVFGMPLIAFTTAPNPDVADKRNIHAALFHIVCNLQKKGDFQDWGKIPDLWRGPMGNVIILRRDGKPLSPSYVEAMFNWINDALHPRF